MTDNTTARTGLAGYDRFETIHLDKTPDEILLVRLHRDGRRFKPCQPDHI
ncbi:MAG: hypothetical protein ABWZ16_02850 [Microbacterium sp.]